MSDEPFGALKTGLIHLPNTGVSVGVDHPIISKMIDDGFNTFDPESAGR